MASKNDFFLHDYIKRQKYIDDTNNEASCNKKLDDVTNIEFKKPNSDGKKLSLSLKKTETKNDSSFDNCSQFWQHSQVYRDIDAAIAKSTSPNTDEEEETIPSYQTSNNEAQPKDKNSGMSMQNKENYDSSTNFIKPTKFDSKSRESVKKIVKEYKMCNIDDMDIDLNISEIFDSTIYRQEMATSFNNLETSILHANDAKSMEDSQLSVYDWHDESMMSKANEVGKKADQTITSMIKSVLMDNAYDRTTKKHETNVEVHIESAFKNLGPFYGLPVKVKQLIQQYKGIEQLYDWQDECLNLDAIKTRKNLIYTLPTSGGKTLVSEILILREILCRKKNALFVLPYVSIVQEKIWALSSFAIGLDFLLEEYAAGRGRYPPIKRRHKKSVYIATIEKALGLVNSLIETDRLDEIGLIVVDELHLIGEEGRGATLETLLTKLMYTESNIQMIGMTATIGNLPDICQFLNAEFFTKDFRPVELVEYIKCGDTIALSKKNEVVPVRKVQYPYTEEMTKIDPDKIGGLVMEVVPEGSCLIFCPSKKNSENVALLLTRVLNKELLNHKKHERDALLRTLQTEGEMCEILRKTLPFGIAYHHSGLTMDERRTIEDGFRTGTLCVICCTSTLAAGVNLPAKRVLLRSPYIGIEFINLSRYKQMVGRAGRAGFGEVGESILLCEKQDLPRVIQLLHAPMDVARSRLTHGDAKGLRSLVLSCIVLGIATTRKSLQEFVRKTLLAVQQDALEVDVKKAMDEAITDLFKRGALQINMKPDSMVLERTIDDVTPEKTQVVIRSDMRLTISKLGRAAIKGGMDLDRARILYEDLLQAQASLVLLDCLHLLYLVTPYDLVQQIKPSMAKYYEIYIELGSQELHTAKILGINDACAAKMITGVPIKSVPERVLNRFYLTLMLNALWNGKTVFQVSNKFQVARGLVQQLMTNAAAFASSVVHFCEELDEFWAFADLLKGMSLRLQHCSSKELLPLMELPYVKLSRAKQLYAAGYRTLQSIAKADPGDLMDNIEHLSRKVANQLIATAKLSLLEKVENLREEAEDVLEGLTQNG